LQKFTRPNEEGQKLLKRRAELEVRASALNETLGQTNKEREQACDVDAKRRLEVKAQELKKQIEALKADSKGLEDLGNTILVELHEQVRETLAELARNRNLDVVEGFLGVRSREELLTPAAAQWQLQAACVPHFLSPELDLTDEVVDRLNRKYPPN
jgi:hypothetical protein